MTARLAAPRGPDMANHIHRFGPRPVLSAGSLARLVDDAGLTGRGGAGFPTSRKMQSVLGPDAVVIGNGAEGEPLSHKDAWLLQSAPHLVLDGLALAADDITAREAYLYIPSRSVPIIRRALDERREAGLDERKVRIIEAPDTFIAGEKSAVVNRVQGGRALPTNQRTSTSVEGVRGRPTLINNVETLAHMALIARYGPRWFRGVGDPADPGTMLVTLSGSIVGGVIEAPTGTGLTELIGHSGRTDPRGLTAVLLGGYHGRWIAAPDLHGVRLGRGSGTGIVHALGAHECGLIRTAEIVTYLATQSAGQCGPCRNGLPHLAQLTRAVADGHREDGLVSEISRITGLVDGRGSCHHPDGTARLVRSALWVFRVDIDNHRRGVCTAGRSA